MFVAPSHPYANPIAVLLGGSGRSRALRPTTQSCALVMPLTARVRAGHSPHWVVCVSDTASPVEVTSDD